jgi:thiol-disulfide isomerase/thioredoxin
VFVFSGVSWWQVRGLVPGGEPAPELSGASDLPDVTGPVARAATDGGEESIPVLASLRGKKILVYFFAPWCQVCRLSAGNLKSIEGWFGPDVAVVAVALDYSKISEVTAFVHDTGMAESGVVLGNDAIQSAYRISAYPTYYVIAKDGTVSGKSVGYATLAGMVRRLLF